jgi:hypothetical protein
MFRRFLKNTSFNNDGGANINNTTATTTTSTVSRPSAVNTETETSSAFAAFIGLSPSSPATKPGAPNTSWKAHERMKEVVANTLKVEELKPFDTCIEAAESLASTSTSSGRVDEATGLVDCSVLVSADGELLLIPQLQLGKKEQQLRTRASSTGGQSKTTTTRPRPQQPSNRINDVAKTFDAVENVEAKDFWQTQANELGEEYISAVFLGNDLHNNGDKTLNGFSAMGWSAVAASLALKQSVDAMGELSDCVGDILQTKQSVALQESQMIDKLKNVIAETPEMGDSKVGYYQQFLQEVFPDDKRMDVTSFRVGPLLSPGGTVYTALTALEQYYSNIAEFDSNLWSNLTQPSGALTKLREAKMVAEERVKNRQIALQEMMRRAKAVEDELASYKEEAKQRWDEVHKAEVKVSKLVEEKAEEKRQERHRIREKQRMEQMQQDVSHKDASAATSSEIWDIVSAVTAEMDEGSFAPMDIPQLPIEKTWSMDSSEKENDKSSGDSDSLDTPTNHSINSRLELEEIRYELEEECGLPELRRAALSAEEAVENVANSLLSVLSNLDTTSRSARLAAETCLVSSSSAQAACLRSIVEIERTALKERLKQLEELESVANEIDVRADMNHYITLDKKLPGGQSFLGDDDDGGVASALAILNENADGDMGSHSRSKTYTDDDNDEGEEGGDPDDVPITTEYLEEAVEKFFSNNPLLFTSAPNDERTKNAQKEFESTVCRLCKVGEDRSPRARSLRSTICYTINAKRSSHSKIPCRVQFDGLCKVLSSVLSGCDTDVRGVSNAKVILNLSQHFFIREKDKSGKYREIYIKSRIIKHPMWEKDEFWDQALAQDIGELMTHSGVMANFERASSKIVTTNNKKRSEWTQTHKTRWHDLTEEERYEAASQVHAVVFAQLGAMSHSMMDFGCSLERTSAFVRRMSIRNRLPMSQRISLIRHLIERRKDEGSSAAKNIPLKDEDNHSNNRTSRAGSGSASKTPSRRSTASSK